MKQRDLNKAAGLLLTLREGMEQGERRSMKQLETTGQMHLHVSGKQQQVTNERASELKRLRSQAIETIRANQQQSSAYVLDKREPVDKPLDLKKAIQPVEDV